MSTPDVKSLIDGIAQLSQQELPPIEFYGEILGRLHPFMQGAPTAVWLCSGGVPDLLCQQGLDGDANVDGYVAGEAHQQLLSAVQEGGQPRLLQPGAGSEGGDGVNQTDYLLGVCPVKVGDSVVALLESFQQVNGHPERNEAALRLLTIVAGVATSFHRNLELNWRRNLDKFNFSIHKSLHPIQTAFAIANDGKKAIGCDRLSVVFKRGRGCRIEAVSGMESVHRRSNQVRLLQNVAKRVLATGEPFAYPDLSVELPPQLEHAVQDYVDESQTRFLSLMPLFKTDHKSTDDDEPNTRKKKPEVIGAVVAERFSGEPFAVDRVDAVAKHASRALSNAQQHQRIFLLPLWTVLGNAGWLVRARTLPKTLGITALIVGAVLALTLIQKDFTLSAKGTLEPEDRRLVFAPAEGAIVSVHDKLKKQPQPGDARLTVTHADTLATLRSIEVDMRASEVFGQIASTKAERESLATRLRSDERTRPGDPRSQPDRVDPSRMGELKVLEENLRRQEKLHNEVLESLSVHAPKDDNDPDRQWAVISWDVENLLKDRPVSRGQELMTVADLNGEWVLELLLPDKSMGHFLNAQKELGDDLLVTFYLATNPDKKLTGRVKDYSRSARADEKEGLSVRVIVAVDKDEIPDLHPGAEVEANIHCPRAAIGYCWLHPVFEFIQRRVIFPYF